MERVREQQNCQCGAVIVYYRTEETKPLRYRPFHRPQPTQDRFKCCAACAAAQWQRRLRPRRVLQ